MAFKRTLRIAVVAVSATILLGLMGPAWYLVSGQANLGDRWYSSSHEPIGLAPDPRKSTQAVVQVYAARAWSWRGAFGVHTWIAIKPENAAQYQVLDVRVWRGYGGRSFMGISNHRPDRKWYGKTPKLLADLRGQAADEAIPKIVEAVNNYPYLYHYRLWPGPNSNTFTAYIGRAVPELSLNLPPTAIGKDYMGGKLVSTTPSGKGLQINLAGLFGALISVEEGLEINLLGLGFGLNPFTTEFRLPGFGNFRLVDW